LGYYFLLLVLLLILLGTTEDEGNRHRGRDHAQLKRYEELLPVVPLELYHGDLLAMLREYSNWRSLIPFVDIDVVVVPRTYLHLMIKQKVLPMNTSLSAASS
jgi:hypothetical protein